MRYACYVALLALLLATCVSLTRIPKPASASDAAAVTRMAVDGDRMVVVAVANPAGFPPMPEGVGAPNDAAYRTEKATIAAVAKDYHLREVIVWPIVVLRLHCVVLEIVGPQSRDEVLAELSRDPRVRLAQPLVTFGMPGADPQRGKQLRMPAPGGIGSRRSLTTESPGGYLVVWFELKHIGATDMANFSAPHSQLFDRFALPTGT